MRSAIVYSPKQIYYTFCKVAEISRAIRKHNNGKPESSSIEFKKLFSGIFQSFSVVNNSNNYTAITLNNLHISSSLDNHTYKLRLFGFIEGHREPIEIQRMFQARDEYDPQFSEVAEHVNEFMAKLIKVVDAAYIKYDVEDKEKRRKLIDLINGTKEDFE